MPKGVGDPLRNVEVKIVRNPRGMTKPFMVAREMVEEAIREAGLVADARVSGSGRRHYGPRPPKGAK